MAKTIKKTLPWFVILALIGLIGGVGLNFNFHFQNSEVHAESATTSATVSNVVPALGATVEDPVSTGASPTDVGDAVTFKSTSNDPNGDNWYLAICTTNAVTAGTLGGAPTCNVGTWGISTTTVSGAEATASYTALVGAAQSNAWWAFACDAASSGQLCSASQQGTGDSGTPFFVNHRPGFTGYQDDSPKGPATTVTWTTTASDTDDDTAQDTVTLYVCPTDAFTDGGSPACTVTELCHSTAVASAPTCGYTTLRPDGNDYPAYGFVVDSHGLAASGGSQGTNSVFEVSNVAPSITESSISLLNTTGSGELALTGEETETTGFEVVFTVVDTNSCVIKGGTVNVNNEVASAFINVRESQIIQSLCNETGEYNANQCYPDAYASWSPSCIQDAATCTDATDTSVTWTCTFPLQYHADPTVTGTPNAANDWIAAVQAEDDDAANTGLIDGATHTNEMDTFMAYNLSTATIAYGAVAPGAYSAEKTTTVEATGNVGLDENISGGIATGEGLCTDYDTCAGSTIDALQQKHNLTAVQGWDDGSAVALSYAGGEAELNCAKTTTTNTPASANNYWNLRMPNPQATGSYTGQNTIEGKVDNESY